LLIEGEWLKMAFPICRLMEGGLKEPKHQGVETF